MKKIISTITLATAGLLAFTSCQDWLDMPSESKADSQSLFENITRAERTVVGAYASLHTQELGYQLLEGTDESSSTESNSKFNVSNYDYTATSSMLSGTYNSMYKAIEYSNVCIATIPGMSVSAADEAKRDMILGEALAIRAYAYWNLVRFFGDVPHPMVPTSQLSTFSSSRVSRDIIWDDCIADLQKAVELLPWQSENMVETPERFTKNAAYGILARVALYAAGYSLRWDLNTVPYDASTVRIAQRDDKARIKELYQIAADACKAVIDKGENELLDKYEDVFRHLATQTYDKETMFQFGWYVSNAPDVRTGYVNGIPTNGSGNTFGKGGSQMIAMPTLYFEYEEGDQRRDVSVCNYGLNSNGNLQLNTYIGNGVGKYRIDWCKDRGASDSRRNIDFPLLRYSDVLLMYAEALNELNNGANTEAVNALKAVRLRAFKKDESKIKDIPTSYQAFKDEIILERKLELSNESLRKSDLTRWGILYEKLTAEKEKLYQLARHEGKYANVSMYRAFKPATAVFQNPMVAMEYDECAYGSEDAFFAKYHLTENEIATLKIQNDGVKGGFVEKKLFEDENGNLYTTKVDGSKEVTYTVVNMYGCHTMKNKGGLSVDEVEGISNVNKFITNMFYGLKKNMVEILPFSTTAIIDVNPGLTNQQHPCY